MAFPNEPLSTKVELQLGDTYALSGAICSNSNFFSYGQIWSDNKEAFNFFSDFDIRIDVAAEQWGAPIAQVLAAKNRGYGLVDEMSWDLILFNGFIGFQWTPTGNFLNLRSVFSTTPVSTPDGNRAAYRITGDLNNGSGGCTFNFYTAPTIAGPWVALGGTVTQAGTTTLWDGSDADLEIGTCNDGNPGFGTFSNFIGRIYAFDLYNGINGTLVASPRFNNLPSRLKQQTLESTSFTDLCGNIWNTYGSSTIARNFVDITDDVEVEHISISRGRANEGSSSDPSSLSFRVDNTTGNYSPRNPNGTYFDKLRRNTLTRVSVTGTEQALVLPTLQSYVFCADSVGTSVLGDLDLRIELDLVEYDSVYTTLICKWVNSDTGRSYAWFLDPSGLMNFYWTVEGKNLQIVTCDQPIPLPRYGKKALRVILDVNNGSGGNTVKFYTSDAIDGTWVQLGFDSVGSGSTSIFNSTAETYIGGFLAPGPSWRRYLKAEVRNGIDGTVVAGPDFTATAVNVRSFTDAQSNRWFLTGLARLTSQNYRFYGELTTQPPKWDKTGRNKYVQMKAAGITRRIGQGQSPLASTLYRALSAAPETVAYWPCEDGKDSKSFTSGIPNGLPMDVVSGNPTYSSNSTFNCSKPLPQLQNSSWTGYVQEYSSTGEAQLWFLMFVPQALASEIAIARIWMTDGTAIIWQLSLDIDGALRLIAVSSDITLLMDSDSITFNSNNKPLRVSIELRQNGANIDWAFLTLEAGQSTGTFFNGTLNDATLGTIHRVDISQDSLLTDVVIGHVAVNKNVLGIFSFGPQLAAYNGEKAGDRFTRLIGENNIYGHVLGGGKDTIPMGPQTPQTLDTLLKEIETTDGGILYEPRWFNGLVYRTRSSIYSQDALTGPILELDYSQAHLSTFEPIDDDQNTRNDFTANKTNGGSARQVLDDESSLSISSIGRYDTSVEVNVASNEQLPDLASWGLTLGTVDQARYPEIVIQTERSIFTSDAELTESARKLDIGDYVRITGIPSWLPPEDVNQLVQGLNEDLHNFNYGITIHTAPADPWNIALYEDPQSRYESKGSFLLAELTAGGTSLSVSTPEGALWGDSDGDFDIMIGGERMTVTAVTGTTSPQTFTVTRAVNGISKSHSVGDVVRLFRQVRYAF